MVGILGFYNGDGVGLVVIEHIVSILCLAASHQVTPEIDLTIGKLYLGLHRDIFHRPALFNNGWRDVSQLDVFF